MMIPRDEGPKASVRVSNDTVPNKRNELLRHDDLHHAGDIAEVRFTHHLAIPSSSP